MIDMTRTSRFWNFEWTWKLPCTDDALSAAIDAARKAGDAVNAVCRGNCVCRLLEIVTDPAGGTKVAVVRWHLGLGCPPAVIAGRLANGRSTLKIKDPHFHELRPEDRPLAFREVVVETLERTVGMSLDLKRGTVSKIVAVATPATTMDSIEYRSVPPLKPTEPIAVAPPVPAPSPPALMPVAAPVPTQPICRNPDGRAVLPVMFHACKPGEPQIAVSFRQTNTDTDPELWEGRCSGCGKLVMRYTGEVEVPKLPQTAKPPAKTLPGGKPRQMPPKTGNPTI